MTAADPTTTSGSDAARSVPAAPRTAEPCPSRPLGLLGTGDLGWIAALVATVVGLAGQPWRVALDAIDAGTWMPGSREVPARRLAAAVHALRRMLAGRAYSAALAREARQLVLGAPALTADAREGRLAAAAVVLDVSSRDLEQLMWADLPRERPIELPAGRPSELAVAAHANVGLVQRALRHAHAVELRISGDPGRVLRGAAARGLLVTASHLRGGDAHETVLDIVGPLALCHGTSVYGRALGTLVPLLGASERFALTIHAEVRGQAYELSLDSPVLLPAAPAIRPWPLVERLARDLERLGMTVIRAPAAIASGDALVCPDLGIATAGRTVWIEIVGFWTPAYLARKQARYQAAGAGDVVLCVDGTRACEDEASPDGISLVRFERRVHADALAQLLGAGRIKVG